jgi:hypothetical protein
MQSWVQIVLIHGSQVCQKIIVASSLSPVERPNFLLPKRPASLVDCGAAFAWIFAGFVGVEARNYGLGGTTRLDEGSILNARGGAKNTVDCARNTLFIEKPISHLTEKLLLVVFIERPACPLIKIKAVRVWRGMG